jgi:hypothetical protein
MFIALADYFCSEPRRGGMCYVAPTGLGMCWATVAINIPPLRGEDFSNWL